MATSTADPGAASLGIVTAPLKFPLLSGVSVASTGPVMCKLFLTPLRLYMIEVAESAQGT